MPEWVWAVYVIFGLVAVGGPWLVAYARRRVTRRWVPSPPQASRDRRWIPDAYGPVWFSHQFPRASMRPSTWRASGTLHVGDTNAKFVATNGQTTILDGIRSVELGGPYRNPFLSIWIKVSYTTNGTEPRVAYVCDGRWWGWQALLTRSGEDLANALAAISLRTPAS